MLERPRSPLPRRLRRPVSPMLRTFVRKRHKSVRSRKVERFKRGIRRMENMSAGLWIKIRRWGLLVIFLTLLGLFTFLIFSPVIQVREIRVQRSEARVEVEKVQKALAPLFGRHLLFLPTFEVEALLQAAIPDLDQVTVTKHYPSELVVKVSLRPILAKLDIETPAPATVAGTGAVASQAPKIHDYLTDNGTYISSPLELTGSTTLVIRDWTLRPVPGVRLLTKDTLTFIRNAEASVQTDFGLHVIRRVVYLRAQEVHLQAGKISIWFDTRSPLPDQLQRLMELVKGVGLKNVKEYVDLRLSGRVVYR